MNLKEILHEDTKINVPFNSILIRLLKAKYPTGKFVDVGDGVETTNEEYGKGKPGLLVVCELVTEEIDGSAYVGINVVVAYTGKYTGVLSSAIKQATEQMLRLVPNSKPALFLKTSDESNGAWDKIATSLNYKLVNMQGISEGRVKDAYMNGTYNQPYAPTLPKPEENYFVSINGKQWKSFPTEQTAMKAADAIYNKNPKLRVSVTPK